MPTVLTNPRELTIEMVKSRPWALYGAYSVVLVAAFWTVGLSPCWIGLQSVGPSAAFGAFRHCIPCDLVSLWPGDDDVQDRIGNNHGTVVGKPAFESGQIGRAFSFGEDGRLEVSHAKLPVGTLDRTLVLWFKTLAASSSSQHILVAFGRFSNKPGQIYEVGILNGRAFFSNWGESVTSEEFIKERRWYHLAVSNRSNEVRLYLDGERAEPFWQRFFSARRMGIATPEDPDLYIGTAPPLDFLVKGHNVRPISVLIDEVGIYDQALADSEIRAIYIVGRNGQSITTCSPR